MAKFHRQHPGVEIAVTEGSSERMATAVRSGELDVALIGAAGKPPAGLDAITIVSENLSALIPPGHRLARRARLPVSQLDGEPIVSMPTGTGIRATLDIGCAAAGFTPHITIEANAAYTVAELTDRGFGVGVLSASMTTRYRKRLTALPVTGIPLPTVLAVVWSASANPAARAFIPQLRAAFGH